MVMVQYQRVRQSLLQMKLTDQLITLARVTLSDAGAPLLVGAPVTIV
jgi:hypothetical protein